MPRVSVIIPTHNRPRELKNAVRSVLNQTYQDFEIIVIDDGLARRAETVIGEFKNEKITYIKHETEKGGGAARNTGIKNTSGEFIAFLDDDDEWLPEKLAIQVKALENTETAVGYSFTAVVNITDDGEFSTTIPEGVNDFYERALRRFSGFLTVTLMIKKFVFDEVGMFDEKFPSHQEPDLMIRVAKKYKGAGINQPLTIVNMKKSHEHVNRDLNKKIAGRRMILEKYIEEFKTRPKILAKHYFDLAIFYRDNNQIKEAQEFLLKSLKIKFNLRVLIHYLWLKIKKI